MAESSSSAPYSVCQICLMAIVHNPAADSKHLLTLGCFKPELPDHGLAQRVLVRWNFEQERIERVRNRDLSGDVMSMSHPGGVRQLPREVPQMGRRFILCDRGWRCGGDNCTFAHSQRERDVWNERILSRNTSASSGRFSYGDKIGNPFQPMNNGPATFHTSHPSHLNMSPAYNSNYAASTQATSAPAMYNLPHTGHPFPGPHLASASMWAPTPSTTQEIPFNSGGYPQQHQQQPQYFPQQHHGHAYGQQHYQPSMRQPLSDHSTGSEANAWQVQHSRRRRRYATDPGDDSTEYHTPSALPVSVEGVGQHQHVGRVHSEPTYHYDHQHIANAPLIKEDPWPSLGSPTTTRAFPLLGSHPQPYPATQQPAVETFPQPHPPQPHPPQQGRPPQEQQPVHYQVPAQQATSTPLPSQQHPVPPSDPVADGGTINRPPPPSRATRTGSEYKPSPGDVIYESLTAANYKNKFQQLLKCEESTHKSILENRCNGEYQLVLHQSGLKRPSWMTRESEFRHVRYGYINLSGDQIAYAVQAAQDREGVTLKYDGNTICTADILSENYSHVEEKLYIGFDLDGVRLLNHSECPVANRPCSFSVHICFKLKHSYFNNLQRALERLRADIIRRLTPDQQSFVAFQPNVQLASHPMFRAYEKLCSPDQLHALKTIALCPSSGPPVLIAGPFGTGKTRVLAVTVRFLFEQPAPFVRILVCTQQRVSADTFLETFLNLQQSWNSTNIDAFVVREYGFHNPKLKRYYRNVQGIQSHIRRYPQQNRLLLVTTCLTAPHLASFLQRNFFTHIFIDEGAQMREPEAVAPLCLASSNTMIVIAGDHHQVGPSMLVLGSKARDNGLDKSLLERLLLHYGTMDHVTVNHRVTLVTNYRCHPDILELSGNLFYETPLKPPADKAPPLLHPDYSTAFVFVCSSVSEAVADTNRNTNKDEAIIVLKKLKELNDRWPYNEWKDRDLHNACIMSPSRSQLTVISKLIDDRQMGYSRLRSIRRLPTYDMQGREFRFLLLSTSEPTTDDGYIKNPTKSFCDRFVFNTAITRAQSMIVSVGNPFVLLEVEKLMIMRYGEKGKCWSTYLDYCLRNKTMSFDESLQLSRTKQKKFVSKIREIVKERQSRDYSTQPMTPSANDDVFSTAEDFPPLQPSASQAPPTSRVRSTSMPAAKPQVQTQPQLPPQPTVPGPVHHPPEQNTRNVQQHNPQVQPQPPAKSSTLSTSKPHLPQQSPHEVQLRPQTQQAKQVPWGAKKVLSPTSPKTRQPQTLQDKVPARQPNPQSNTRQTGALGTEQRHPKGTKHTHAPVSQQTQQHSTQLHSQPAAAFHSNDRRSYQPESYSTLAGRRHTAKPSTLMWGKKEAGLAPGTIESPAEFPPLNAASSPKGRKQNVHAVMKQIDRPVLSNSIRDLSSKQIKRKKEIKGITEEKRPGDGDEVDPKSLVEAIPESELEIKQDASFKSARCRFEEDFTVKEVLGRGAFGVVFHVKSKFDLHEYALKLTRLPDDKNERLKVMREVRALATLVQDSHQNVVRYNTSWEERAPSDWKTREHWCLLEGSSEIIFASSSEPVLKSTPVGESSAHTSPSSADSPSDSTIQSAGALSADTSDSVVEFRDETQRDCNEKEDQPQLPGSVNVIKKSWSNPLTVVNPPKVLMIQTELCEKRTLKNWLLENLDTREKKTVVGFFDQIVDALRFIHQQREGVRLVHRDLKPSNIFFARGKSNHLKIGDFGLVKTAVIESTVQNPLKDSSSRQQSPSQGYYAGTPLYMSPEQRQGKGCDQKVDIYALGVIFFELNCPFRTESQRYKELVRLNEDSSNLPKGFRDKLPNEVTTIVQRLMNKNPNLRPSAAEIKDDKFGDLKRLRKKVGKRSKPSYIPVL